MKRDVIEKLRSEILALEGVKAHVSEDIPDLGLDFMSSSFPGNIFPIASVHEFISESAEDITATTGFICGLLSALVAQKGPAL